jgi:hypothetical protein
MIGFLGEWVPIYLKKRAGRNCEKKRTYFCVPEIPSIYLKKRAGRNCEKNETISVSPKFSPKFEIPVPEILDSAFIGKTFYEKIVKFPLKTD